MVKRGSYGYLLAETGQGRWYWDDLFKDISFVPKRHQRRTVQLLFGRKPVCAESAAWVIIRYLCAITAPSVPAQSAMGLN